MDDALMTDEVRAAGRALMEQLATDDDAAAAFEADPVAAMEAAGIPRELMGDLLVAVGDDGSDDVDGFEIKTQPQNYLSQLCSPTRWCNAAINGPTLECGGGVVSGKCGQLGIGAMTLGCTRASWYR